MNNLQNDRSFMGCYYLHSNGSMIWKNKNVFINTTIEEYFDSPGLVIKYWPITAKNPDTTKKEIDTMLEEAKDLGADESSTTRIRTEFMKQYEKAKGTTEASSHVVLGKLAL